MSPSFFIPLDETNFNQNSSNISVCVNGVSWIWFLFGDCVRTPREQASAYLGMSSMIAWLFVVLPQIWKNFCHLEGMAGISFFLLLQWASGDVTNLLGAFLTKQLKMQIILACYFVMTDVVLMSQYIVYRYMTHRKQRDEDMNAAASPVPRLMMCLMGFALFSCGHFWPSFISGGDLSVAGDDIVVARHLSRSLLSVSAKENTLFQSSEYSNGDYSSGSSLIENEDLQRTLSNGYFTDEDPIFWHVKRNVIGYAIGILSSILYLGSRLAQIFKNAKVQSTEGLAVMTFMLAIVGNLAYGGQILVRDLSQEFLLEKTPWLVGSLGVVGLDCILLIQFHYYGCKSPIAFDEMKQALLNSSSVTPINVAAVDISENEDEIMSSAYIYSNKH